MAKGDKPVVPQKEAKGKKQEDCSSEDLECRSRKLGLALMRQEALKKREYKKRGEEQQDGFARAVKLSSEFLASIIVGAVLGLGFDKIVGSLPWGLVFFLFLGFAAGIVSILRSVGYIAPSQLGQKGVSRQGKGANKKVR
ncbi:AtpZ/AtpI family protein [Bartonella rattaustraliani]|uniref:AtpZ/AtpI family protein n=1 Tax=Bartonella rattaustraliani TaxID=481139 RepID=UPI0003183D5C|nr:AtpZ/AtpI family protein [Bartonella rattaustraliani]